MSDNPELALRQSAELSRQQGRIVERRKAFLASVPEGSEAHKLHSDQLRGEQKILDDLKAIEAEREKAVMDARAASAAKTPETSPEPATGLQTPANT